MLQKRPQRPCFHVFRRAENSLALNVCHQELLSLKELSRSVMDRSLGCHGENVLSSSHPRKILGLRGFHGAEKALLIARQGGWDSPVMHGVVQRWNVRARGHWRPDAASGSIWQDDFCNCGCHAWRVFLTGGRGRSLNQLMIVSAVA